MAVVYRCVGTLTGDVVVFFRNPSIFHSWDSFPSTFCPRLWETSSGVVAVGVFAAEARREQSGFQHTDRPRPSSPELFNKDRNAGRESLSHLIRGKFSSLLVRRIDLYVSTGKMYGLIWHESLKHHYWRGGQTLKPNSQFHEGMCPISWLLRMSEHHQLLAVDIHAKIWHTA